MRISDSGPTLKSILRQHWIDSTCKRELLFCLPETTLTLQGNGKNLHVEAGGLCQECEER